MAVANWFKAYTIVAGADLSACQYTGVNYAGVFGTAADFEGVLQNKPKLGEHAAVCFVGLTVALVGGAVTAGQRVTIAASGYFTSAASGGFALGRCIFGAASGGLATVRLFGGNPSAVSSV